MKVCDLTQFYSPVSGGVRRYLHEKMAFLGRQGGHEHVLIVPGPRSEVTADGNSRVYTIHAPLISRQSRYRALLDLRAVGEILRKENPDIIESSDPYQIAWKTIAMGRELKRPVVAYYHSHFAEIVRRVTERSLGPAVARWTSNAVRRYVRSLYNQFAVTLVPSEPLAEILRSWAVENARVLPLGVDASIFRPEPDDRLATRRSLGIRADRRLLLYVGRLSKDKNVRALFGAFDLLDKEVPDQFYLLVVGDGPERSKLQWLLRQGANVSWVRYLADSAELARFYRAADLFVHPGLYETFGLVTLESQACGTPVLGFRGSPMDSVILHGLEAWPKTNSPRELANAIRKFGENPPLLGRDQLAAETTARYDWNRVFTQLLCIYDELCAKYQHSNGKRPVI